MENRSHQLSGRYEKDQLGCMWGLMSMFDFRHDRTAHRLLQDGRNGKMHGAGQSAVTRNDILAASENALRKLDEGQATNRCRSSVKKLIEEEMLVEKASDNEKCNSGEVMKQQSSVKGDKKQKQKKKKGRSKSLDNIYGLDAFHQQSHKPSSNSIDNGITMEELCNNIAQRSMDCLKHGDQGEIYLQGSQGTPDFEEKLGEAVKFLVSQKLTDEHSLTENRELQTSKEVMEALQILSSDEDLFLKLLRDPNSLVVRYVPDLHDAPLKKDEDFDSFSGSKYSEQKLDNLARSNEQLGRRRKYHFFRRKLKANAREAFRENKDLHTSKKIVILKPGPAITRNLETGSSPAQAPRSQNSEANGEAGSEISLSEIKIKLKRAMGKYHRRTYSDGHFPIEHQNVVDDVVKGRFGMSLPTENHFSTEKVCVHPSDTKEKEMSKWAEDSRISEDRTSSDVSNQKVANIYIEAKKHLSDLLNSGHGDVDASSRQSPKTLGKILALSDFNMSPISSPDRNGFMTAKMRFASVGEFQKVDEEDMQNKHASNLSPTAGKSESRTCTSNDGTNSRIEINDMNILVDCVNNHLVEETSPLVGLKMTVEDTSMTTKETEATVKEESNCLGGLSEPSNCSIKKDDGDVSEIQVFEESSDFECSKQNCCPMDQQHVSSDASPSKSPVSKQVEYAESSDDLQGRPSPISVLEPLFSDDEASPAMTRSRSAETSLRPTKIQFDGCDSSVARETHHSKTSCTDDKKIVLNYVMAVLEVSGLNWEKLCVVSFSSSDQPLDPSLVEEVELLTNNLCPDQRLLFDCINEALMHISMHYSAYAPWVSFAESNVRPIPTVENMCQEIFQEVCWHLQPIPLPHTLEQIVRKDMLKIGTWLDVRHDTDCICAEIGAVILEDLMDDSMVSFMDASEEDGGRVFVNKVDETLNCDYRDESSTTVRDDDHGVSPKCNKEDAVGVGEC